MLSCHVVIDYFHGWYVVLVSISLTSYFLDKACFCLFCSNAPAPAIIGNPASREEIADGAKKWVSGGVIDYDEMYNTDDEEDLDSLEEHGSVISHLLSQVKLGMDLTKVVLPTFILECRSLLEMYADFFAHPDLFTR